MSFLPPCGESGKGGRSSSWAGMGSCPWAAAVPRKRSGARTCQTLCVWLISWTTDTCEDREKGRKEGRKRKESKRLLLAAVVCVCLSLCVCLPTNTLSSPFPPSLAPSLEFVQLNSPRLSFFSSSSSSSEPTTAELWTLVSEICTSVQSTSSDYRCKWVCLPLPAASRSTYPVVLRHPTAAEKGGHRRPPLRGWRQDSRDTCQTVTSGGWRLDTDLLRPSSYCFRGRHWIYTLLFFHVHSLCPSCLPGSVIGSGQSIL